MPFVSLRSPCSSSYSRRLQRTYIRHLIARVLCLIVLPFCVYALCFKLHFIILNQSGPGDSQMSSLFQAHLEGNDFARKDRKSVV